MPRLLIEKAGTSSQVFELSGDRPISIGRAKSSNVVLDDESVSRLHAVVRSTPEGRWEIVDRASANGLKINGKAVREANLHPNDEITIGAYQLRFEEPNVHPIASHDTAELPRSFVQELTGPAYSGSLLPAMPLGSALSDIEMANRLRMLERENRLLTILYRVTKALSDLDAVDEVTDRVLDLALQIEGAERGYAMLLNEFPMKQTDFTGAAYGFRPALIRYRRPATDSDRERRLNLVISKSIVREVMQTGVPLLIANVQDDPRVSDSQSVINAGIQSAMCAPLAVRERRFGLLYVDNFSRRGVFSKDELNVFAVVAAQAGFAIERVSSKAEAQ
jgi:FHA domain-containing protein/GAF domain-containing protein